VRIYTRTGDAGETGLFGGERVRKDTLRVAAYGDVDELNAALGLALATECFGDLRAALQQVQGDLFVLGADLAAPAAGTRDRARRTTPRVTGEMVAALERMIDRFEAGLEPLCHFILPGGTVAAAALHLARAVCRRAERRIITLAASEPVGPAVVPYINRLSDLLFVLARAANHHARQPDTIWEPPAAAGGDASDGELPAAEE
jgi:cob(I)alamin adenosyltransferase